MGGILLLSVSNVITIRNSYNSEMHHINVYFIGRVLHKHKCVVGGILLLPLSNVITVHNSYSEVHHICVYFVALFSSSPFKFCKLHAASWPFNFTCATSNDCQLIFPFVSNLLVCDENTVFHFNLFNLFKFNSK